MPSQPSPPSGDDTPTGNEADDVRRQFREALDRKHGHASVGDAGGNDLAGKPHHASGPAKAQRTFRRKSGG